MPTRALHAVHHRHHLQHHHGGQGTHQLGDLWDEQYAGNILMFNNSRDAYAIAAFKSGHDINPQSTKKWTRW